MAKLLKGNYKLSAKKSKSKGKSVKKNPFQEFESEAIKNLGGSIAFVSKRELLWTGDKNKDEKVK